MLKYILLGLFFPILLFAQNLNDLIQMSLVNKNVEATKISNESIKDEYESVKSGYLPKVSIGAGYTDVSQETSGYANNAFNTYVDVSYTLYDGGKKDLTYKSYESQIKGSKEDLKSLKNLVSLDIVDHYFNYLTYTSQKTIMVPFFKTSKTSFFISPLYDTSGNSFCLLGSKILSA